MTYAIATLVYLCLACACLVLVERIAKCRCWQIHNRITFLRAAGRYWMRVGP